MNRIYSRISGHPVSALIVFMFAVFALGSIGVEITRINIRFAMMTS